VYLGLAAFAVARAIHHGDAYPAMAALASVGLVVGVLSGLKHSHEGVQQAVSSRLLPWPTLSWCALVAVLGAQLPAKPNTQNLRPIAIGLVAGMGLLSFAAGAYRADERYDAFRLGRDALLNEPRSDALRYLHPRPDIVRAYRADLVRHGLTCFRETKEKTE